MNDTVYVMPKTVIGNNLTDIKLKIRAEDVSVDGSDLAAKLAEYDEAADDISAILNYILEGKVDEQ